MAKTVKQVELSIKRSQDKIIKLTSQAKSEKENLQSLKVELKEAKANKK